MFFLLFQPLFGKVLVLNNYFVLLRDMELKAVPLGLIIFEKKKNSSSSSTTSKHCVLPLRLVIFMETLVSSTTSTTI
jgi:hypothetical protein